MSVIPSLLGASADHISTRFQEPLGSVLIIAGDVEVSGSLASALEAERYEIEITNTIDDDLNRVASGFFDLVLLDFSGETMGALAILHDLRRHAPLTPVVGIVQRGAVDVGANAIRAGATNLVLKPWDNEKLISDVQNTIAEHQAQRENAQLRHALTQRADFSNIVGASEPMLRVLSIVAQVAPSRATVLLHGETGTGKELIAKAIHVNSPRRDRPFVPVNSGSIPSGLLESTLFGHVKGAFTSATWSKRGLFEVADSGTLFLDEIATIPLETQAKLLRVLQERRFTPLGSYREIQVDVRIIAATNVDLQQLVREGKFREDLYYRLNVITIDLPPLRNRRDDIPLLAGAFLKKFAAENNRPARSIAPDAMAQLVEYEWPGNVRELENVIERAIVLSHGPVLETDVCCKHLEPIGPSGDCSLPEIVDYWERRTITEALERFEGNQSQAARFLRVPIATLRRRIKRLKIRVRRKQTSSGGTRLH